MTESPTAATASKTCTRCGESKPLDEYGLDPRGRSGRQARCSTCQASVRRARYAADPEKERTQQRARKASGVGAALARAARASRRAAGLCHDCTVPALPGLVRCHRHHALDLERTTRRYSRARAALLLDTAERLDLHGVCYLCESDLGEGWHVEHPAPIALDGPEDLHAPGLRRVQPEQGRALRRRGPGRPAPRAPRRGCAPGVRRMDPGARDLSPAQPQPQPTRRAWPGVEPIPCHAMPCLAVGIDETRCDTTRFAHAPSPCWLALGVD